MHTLFCEVRDGRGDGCLLVNFIIGELNFCSASGALLAIHSILSLFSSPLLFVVWFPPFWPPRKNRSTSSLRSRLGARHNSARHKTQENLFQTRKVRGGAAGRIGGGGGGGVGAAAQTVSCRDLIELFCENRLFICLFIYFPIRGMLLFEKRTRIVGEWRNEQ